MKMYLEITLDDNGQFHLSTDFTSAERKRIASDPSLYDKELRTLLQAMVNEVWRDRRQTVSQLIRVASMVEILSCAQPYSQAEEYWSTMMFSFIPLYEKAASIMKTPYGFKDKEVIRPQTFLDTSIMPFSCPSNKN